MTKNTLTVALTLDFDAHTGLLDAGYHGPTDRSRGAYGALSGIPRIIETFSRLNVPLTCFIPGTVAETYPQSCQALVDAGFEIGHHGYSHQSPLTLGEQQERDQIEHGLHALSTVLNVTPKGYRAPWLRPSTITTQLLSEYGFAYDASECGADRPYLKQSPQHRLIEIPGKLELIDTPLFMNFSADGFPPTAVNVSTVDQIWRDEFTAMYHAEEALVFVHTIHPFCIGHLSRLNMYEQFVTFMQSHDDVNFLTMNDIASEYSTVL